MMTSEPEVLDFRTGNKLLFCDGWDAPSLLPKTKGTIASQPLGQHCGMSNARAGMDSAPRRICVGVDKASKRERNGKPSGTTTEVSADRLVDELVLRAAEPAHLFGERRPSGAPVVYVRDDT